MVPYAASQACMWKQRPTFPTLPGDATPYPAGPHGVSSGLSVVFQCRGGVVETIMGAGRLDKS